MFQSALCVGPAAPAGVACQPDGALVVADPLAHRLWRCGPGLVPRPVTVTRKAGERAIAAPTVVRLDAAGRTTFLERDERGARVRRLGAAGELETLYEAPARRDVRDLAVAPDGAVYMALQELSGGAPWVARLAGQGRLVPLYGGEAAPRDPDLAIATGPDGSLYVLHGQSLWRAGPEGDFFLVARDASLAMSAYDASCLAVGPDGRVVATFAEAGRVVRLAPDAGRVVVAAQADPWRCGCDAGARCVHSPAYPAIDRWGRAWAVDGLKRRVVRLPV